MIKNERQYRITKAEADKFEATIAKVQSAPEDKRVHPKLRKAQIDALKSQLADLRTDIEEYQALRSGKQKVLELTSFDDLPRALIQARIASGMGQEELAKRLGLKPQQLQRYEATDYAAASFTRVSEVAKAVGLSFVEVVLGFRSTK